MFIYGADNTKSIAELLAENDSICAAVAFLGSGAEALLAPKGASTRILCNVESGATNPYVVEDLLDAGVRVKTNPRLHAKVYLGESSAIVGSANLSSNGLSLEGDQVNGWHEAGYKITDEGELAKIRTWFGNLWTNGRTVRRDDAVLKAAKRIWAIKQRSASPNGEKPRSLLTELRDNPGFFRGRRVWFVLTTDVLSREAENVKRKWQQESGIAGIGDCYEDWDNLPESAYLIDLFIDRGGHVSFHGLWETPPKKILIPFRLNGKTLRLFVVRRVANIYGMTLNSQDKKLISKNALQLLFPKAAKKLPQIKGGEYNKISIQDARRFLFTVK